jgi:hypothetical protein
MGKLSTILIVMIMGKEALAIFKIEEEKHA